MRANRVRIDKERHEGRRIVVVEVLSTLLRWASLIASAVVFLSFVMFALDETRKGSDAQVQKIEDSSNQPAPTARGERFRERNHSAARELIDDGNDVLVRPFASLTEDEGLWVQRIISGLLALLLYGLGVGLLANYIGRSRKPATDPFSFSGRP